MKFAVQINCIIWFIFWNRDLIVSFLYAVLRRLKMQKLQTRSIFNFVLECKLRVPDLANVGTDIKTKVVKKLCLCFRAGVMWLHYFSPVLIFFCPLIVFLKCFPFIIFLFISNKPVLRLRRFARDLGGGLGLVTPSPTSYGPQFLRVEGPNIISAIARSQWHAVNLSQHNTTNFYNATRNMI